MNSPSFSPYLRLHWRYLHILRTSFSCECLGLWLIFVHLWTENDISRQKLLITYIRIMIPDEYPLFLVLSWIFHCLCSERKIYSVLCGTSITTLHTASINDIIYYTILGHYERYLPFFAVKGWISTQRKYSTVSELPWFMYQLYWPNFFWKYLITSPIYFLWLLNQIQSSTYTRHTTLSYMNI